VDVDDTNLLVEMIKALLASSAPHPVVLYSKPVVTPPDQMGWLDVQAAETIRLLPVEWQVEVIDEGSFASRVSVELASRPVVAIPPWGRQEGSPVLRQAAALQGVQPSASNHPLLLVLSVWDLRSQAGQQLRMDLAARWQFLTVATCLGGLQKEVNEAIIIGWRPRSGVKVRA
jgi:hypothetical protein